MFTCCTISHVVYEQIVKQMIEQMLAFNSIEKITQRGRSIKESNQFSDLKCGKK